MGENLAKIRPLQDKVNRSLQQFGVFSKDFSIDEQMVPYFGRHSSKLFIRGKPIRFGYKNWVLTPLTVTLINLKLILEHPNQKIAVSLLNRKLFVL